eukprot:XP_019929214.1 PREDICTED: uncharacterized protein LOC105344164 [Crassostrea gigas]
MCLQKCDCSTCHHVQGCMSTPRITETTIYEYETLDGIKETTKSQESTSYEKENKTPGHETNSGRNVVMFVGSVFSFLLIFAIIREICLCCRYPRPTGEQKILDDVYTDIGEMENRGTE